MDGFMTGQAIYENFAGRSLNGLPEGGAHTSRIADNYANRAWAMNGLAMRMELVWQGEAGSAARRAAGPLANEHAVASEQITNAAQSMGRQAEAFDLASNSVVPVPDMPKQPAAWDNIAAGVVAQVAYERQVTEVQAATEHNIAVMRAYEDATRQNQTLLTDIPGRLNPIKPPDGQPPGPGPRPLPWRVPGPGGGGRAGGGQTPGAGGPGTAGWTAPQPSQSRPTELGQTRPESAQPVLPQVSGLDGGSPRPIVPAPQPGGLGVSVSVPGPVSGGPGTTADPRRSGGGPAGTRGFGTGGHGEDGARSGGRSGIGPRGVPGVDAGTRGAGGGAGRGGTGGPSGGPTGAGSRGQGGEDFERERPSYLVDPDPDETFGTDEVTAPPVIGG